MPTRFLSGTPLSRIEVEMQLVPGFRPRGGGMVVSRYAYTPADCDCRYCTERSERKNSACPVCHYLRERFVAGCVGLTDLRRILAAESRQRAFVARVEALSRQAIGFFKDEAHRQLFQQLVAATMSPAYGAALYLLTAEPSLWCAAQSGIRHDGIRFQDIRLHGINEDGYALFHAAKDIYCDTKHISLSELADPEVISDGVFRLIMDALLIRRYGTTIINIFKEGAKC